MKVKALTVGLVAALAAIVAPAAPAGAVTPGEVKAAIETAYTAYNKFFGNQLTLDQATAQIVGAINAARDGIIAHVDALEVAAVVDCTRSAVNDLVDLPTMSPDVVQAYARDTTDCVIRARDRVPLLGVPSVNEIGFALDAVGPIALIARSKAGFSTAGLRTILVDGNNGLVSRLMPACRSQFLWGDVEPGGRFVEVQLTCTAFNGTTGYDAVIVDRRKPTPPFDYTYAKQQAMVGTSFPLALAVLPLLTT
jgi:hypothetical protein